MTNFPKAQILPTVAERTLYMEVLFLILNNMWSDLQELVKLKFHTQIFDYKTTFLA